MFFLRLGFNLYVLVPHWNSKWYQRSIGTTSWSGMMGSSWKLHTSWIFVDSCMLHFFLKTFAVRSARGWGQTTIGLTVWFISSLRVSQFGSRNPLTTADQMPGHHTSVGCDFKTGPGALVSDWICPVSHCSGLDSHHLNQVLGLCLTVFAPQVPMHAATSDHLYIL